MLLKPTYFVFLIGLLFFVFFVESKAQNSLKYAYSETSGAVSTTTVNTYFDVTSAAFTLENTNAVLVVANFEVSSTIGAGGNLSREANLRLTDGTTNSNVIVRSMSKGGTDQGIGTIIHVFIYPQSSGAKTYKLQHTSIASNPNANIATEAMLSVFEINTASINLDYDIKQIITGVAAVATMNVIAGMETGAVTLSQPGGLYIAAAFNTHKIGTGTLADKGEWVLRYRKGTSGSFIPIGNSINRTFSSENSYGAASLVYVLENQEPGDYYFQLAHMRTTGDDVIYTSNASLIALGLSHSGGVFPSFKKELSSTSTTASSAVVTSMAGSAQNNNTALFMHTQFNMTASAELLLPTFSYNVSDGGSYNRNSLTLNRYIGGPTDIGSGALVSIFDGLSSGTNYTASFIHGTPIPAVTLTTSNVVLTGFQLTDIPPPNNWTGASGTVWNNVANWSGSIPTSTEDVYIPSTGITNYPTITSSANCRNIFIGESASLTLLSDASNASSLIVSGTSLGTASYKNYVKNKAWHILSSPLEGQSIDDFLGDPSNKIPFNGSLLYAFSDYSEVAGAWSAFYPTTGNPDFETGKGYLTGRSDGAVTHGSLSFTGTIVDSSITYPVTKTDRGWNSIGNPFTSAIGAKTGALSASNFLGVNGGLLDPSHVALYLWDQQAVYTGGRNDYKIISNGGYSPDLPNSYIQASQGFLINVSASDNISFTKAMQYHDTGTGLLKSTTTSWDGFKLIAESKEGTKSCVIAFHEDMTQGLDPSYDVGIFKQAGNFAVYSRLAEDYNEVDFQIQCLPEESYDDIIVPIGIEMIEEGVVKFSLAGIILGEDKSILFEDRELNNFVKFEKEEDIYEADVTAGSAKIGRFYLHITLAQPNSITDSEKGDKYSAYWNGSQIVLRGKPELSSHASFIDINGRLIQAFTLKQVKENYLTVSDKRNGIFFLRIIEGNKLSSLKIPVF